MLVASGCAQTTVVPLVKPTKVESFCGEEHNVRRYPRTTSMSSILTSLYDEAPRSAGGAPAFARYRAQIRATGGTIAYYDRLRIYKPALAKSLGSGDEYVVAREALFTNEIAPDGSRYIYLDVLDHGAYRLEAFRAADTQNVCNEGKRLN